MLPKSPSLTQAKLCIGAGFAWLLLKYLQQEILIEPWNGVFAGMKTVAFLCALIAAVAWIRGTVRTFSRRRNWQTANGTITATSIEQFTFDGFEYFDPVIAYRYAVLGNSYNGKRSLTGDGLMCQTKEEAEKIMQEYAVGKSIQIRFNPKKPGKSDVVIKEA